MTDTVSTQSAPVRTGRAEAAEREVRKRDIRTRWLLSAPALAIIICAAAGPLLIVLVYSFLTPGDYGNVKWIFSTKAWVNVVLQQDIFDDSWQWADGHLKIFWRSIRLSLLTTVLTLAFGIPTAYFIATRPGKDGKTP